VSLKQNILSGYFTQVYTAVIGIVMVPVYMRYLGVEAYGLVGFFAMLQAWLQLMDMGLAPTLSRELSRFRAGALSAKEACHLVRSLEWLFGILAAVCIAASLLGSPWIATNWLKVQNLDINEVSTCIAIMGGIGGLKWLTGIYRSGLIGLDKQLSVNGATVIISTLRSVVVVVILMYWSSSPLGFFSYQAVIALIECLAFQQILYRFLPPVQMPILPDWSALHKISRFAGSIAFTAGLWVFIMQLDKLILSHFLSLKDYGYFTLAVSVAAGITLLSAPLIQSLQPRLTILVAQAQDAELIQLYRTATQSTTVIMVSIAGTMAAFSEPLIFAWTGNLDLAKQAAPVLLWYALGNAVVGILSLPYLLQYARGYLRLHVIGNILFGLFWVPAVVFSSSRYGGVGTGVTWFAGNLLFLLVWVSLVHKRLAPSILFSWLIDDIARIAVPAGIVLYGLYRFSPVMHDRLYFAMYIIFAGLCTLVTALFFSSDLRQKLSLRPNLVSAGK